MGWHRLLEGREKGSAEVRDCLGGEGRPPDLAHNPKYMKGFGE